MFNLSSWKSEGTMNCCSVMDIGDADNKELARYHFNTEGKKNKKKKGN